MAEQFAAIVAVLAQLPAMQNDPGYRYSGFSGDLSLNLARRVIRHLPWGKFSKGRARWVASPVTFNLDDVEDQPDSGESAQ